MNCSIDTWSSITVSGPKPCWASLYAIADPCAPPPTITILALLGKSLLDGSMLLPNFSLVLEIQKNKFQKTIIDIFQNRSRNYTGKAGKMYRWLLLVDKKLMIVADAQNFKVAKSTLIPIIISTEEEDSSPKWTWFIQATADNKLLTLHW